MCMRSHVALCPLRLRLAVQSATPRPPHTICCTSKCAGIELFRSSFPIRSLKWHTPPLFRVNSFFCRTQQSRGDLRSAWFSRVRATAPRRCRQERLPAAFVNKHFGMFVWIDFIALQNAYCRIKSDFRPLSQCSRIKTTIDDVRKYCFSKNGK